MKIVSKQWGYDASFDRHEAFEDDGVTTLHYVWFTANGKQTPRNKISQRVAKAIATLANNLGCLMLQASAWLAKSPNAVNETSLAARLER